MLSNEGQFIELEQGALPHMAHLGCHAETHVLGCNWREQPTIFT